MLNKLLLITCLLGSQLAFAQNKNAVTTQPPSSQGQPTPPQEELGAALPPFIVITLPKAIEIKKTGPDGKPLVKMGAPKYITNKDVEYPANLFLMFFNPTCGHCEEMTIQLEKNIALFNKTKILMVASPVARPYLEMFEREQHTDQYKTIMVGTDSLDLIGKLFLYKSLPQINIYDKERKLIKVFSGDTPIDSLKPYIQ